MVHGRNSKAWCIILEKLEKETHFHLEALHSSIGALMSHVSVLAGLVTFAEAEDVPDAFKQEAAMNSNASREERARERIAKNPPPVEAVADASLALLGGFQTFRFLYEVFNVLDRTEAELILSADGAAGLARICEDAGSKLVDAYGPL